MSVATHILPGSAAPRSLILPGAASLPESPAEKPSERRNQVAASGDFTLKEKVVYSLLGAAGATLVVVGIVKGIHLVKARRSDGKAFEVGSAASYAKQIKNVLENTSWWKSYMDGLRPIYRQIKDVEELNEVRKEYRNQNGNDELNTELAKVLKPTELNELLSIMGGKVTAGQPLTLDHYKAWASRINDGVNYAYGTDEEAIKAVFIEIPTQADYAKVSQVYYSLYGVTLDDDLMGDLELWEMPEFLDIIKAKPIA